MAHYGVPVKPSGVAVPVPAATLVLLRARAAGGFDILLMQRHARSKFAAGDYVFPGGKIEVNDNPADAAEWCAGFDAARAATRLGVGGDVRTALGFWIGAIRETFEEVGVLLAVDDDGQAVRVDAPRFAAAMTLRPSPDPRSTTKSCGVTFATSSIFSTVVSGLGTQTTSLPAWPT